MPKETILIVEDEEDIRELLDVNLRKHGYRTLLAASGEEGLKKARAGKPDLILLDLMLPGVDGLEVCRQLKRDPALASVPVMMVTARGEEADIVAGLELGAEDYVVKPFSPRVLVARVKTVLRRKSETLVDERATLLHQELELDPGRHEVLVKGKPVALTLMEFRILHHLLRRPGWVFTRYQIVAAVSGDGAVVTDRTVDVHLVALRRKLGSAGRYVETVRGVGYRWQDG